MKRTRAVSPEGEPGTVPPSAYRPLDLRRIREIRHWLEGNRPDAPTVDELREFTAWVSQEIEFHLARHQPVRDLLDCLNAARTELRAAGEAA